jgi:hypothetical protein
MDVIEILKDIESNVCEAGRMTQADYDRLREVIEYLEEHKDELPKYGKDEPF